MTAAVATSTAGRSGAARRAVLRWSWRLFRREWRQQLLVLVLVVVAVAGTVFGLGFATNTTPNPTTTVGLPGTDPMLDADVAAIIRAFGGGDVIHHQRAALPGSLVTVDVRAQKTAGRHPTLRLVSGRYPNGASEVALTRGAARLLALRVGDTWTAATSRRVVGIVENPQNLDDKFALVASGQADPPASVTILVPGTPERVGPVRIPSGLPVGIEGVSGADKSAVAVTVLAFATLGLLFVGLVAVAGFAVVAQRHLRALGMLGSLGATDRHTRLVLLGDGIAVGASGAAVGLAAGFAAWMVFAPHLETLAGHRINRFDLPWWAIVVAAALAVAAAAGAAWWPGRALTRMSILDALSSRPPRPRPARRFAAVGITLAAVGAVFIVLANHANHKSPILVVLGVTTTTVGVVLLAPFAITVAARLSSRMPVAPRIALRDLGRYQARAGAALGAVILALTIATTVAVASAYHDPGDRPTFANLPADEVVVHLSQDVRGPVPAVTDDGVRAAQQQVDVIATSLGTRDVVALNVAVDPNNPDHPAIRGSEEPGQEPAALLAVNRDEHGVGIKFVQQLYVATPDVLARLHVRSEQLDPTADVVMSRPELDSIRRQIRTGEMSLGADPRTTITPKIQTLDLPTYTSEPTALITSHGMGALGLEAIPGGWLLKAPRPLTDGQIVNARTTAATAGLVIETRDVNRDPGRVGNDATAIGILFALGVLAVTVGLIRAESTHELRTLTATGASPRTRRTLTAVTAGTLGLLGAILGIAAAYLSLAAWYHAHLSPLAHAPIANLLTIGLGLPALASLGGYLLAGREPAAIARRPME